MHSLLGLFISVSFILVHDGSVLKNIAEFEKDSYGHGVLSQKLLRNDEAINTHQLKIQQNQRGDILLDQANSNKTVRSSNNALDNGVNLHKEFSGKINLGKVFSDKTNPGDEILNKFNPQNTDYDKTNSNKINFGVVNYTKTLFDEIEPAETVSDESNPYKAILKTFNSKEASKIKGDSNEDFSNETNVDGRFHDDMSPNEETSTDANMNEAFSDKASPKKALSDSADPKKIAFLAKNSDGIVSKEIRSNEPLLNEAHKDIAINLTKSNKAVSNGKKTDENLGSGDMNADKKILNSVDQNKTLSTETNADKAPLSGKMSPRRAHAIVLDQNEAHFDKVNLTRGFFDHANLTIFDDIWRNPDAQRLTKRGLKDIFACFSGRKPSRESSQSRSSRTPSRMPSNRSPTTGLYPESEQVRQRRMSDDMQETAAAVREKYLGPDPDKSPSKVRRPSRDSSNIWGGAASSSDVWGQSKSSSK